MKRRFSLIWLCVLLALPLGGARASSLTPQQQLNAHYSLYTIDMSLGAYEDALQDIEKCFEYAADADDELMADLHLKRGYVLIILDRPDDALDDLSACLTLTPSSSDAMLLRMQVCAQTGRVDEAFEQAEAYLTHYPKQTDVYSKLGELLSVQSDHGNAIRAFTACIDSGDAVPPETYLLRGQSYLQTGKYPEAIADLTVSIDTAPEQGLRASYLRGVAYLQTGEFDKAASDMAVCVDAVDRSRAEDGQDADREALAAQIDADILNTRYYYGIALIQLGRYQEAIPVFTACAAEGLSPGESIFWRGNCYLEAQDYINATKDFEASMDAGVEADNSLYFLGICAMGMTEYDKAIQLFSQCYDKGIMKEQAQYNRGMCYMQIGENEKAAADLKAAVGTEE